MSVLIRNSGSIAIISAALLSAAGVSCDNSPSDSSTTLNTSFTNKSPDTTEEFAASIAGQNTTWTDAATALWKQDNPRAHAALQQLLRSTDWDLAKEIGEHIVNLADASKEMSPAAQRTLVAAKEAKALELGGTLTIEWASGLSFTRDVVAKNTDRQTQITITPHITALTPGVKFDKVFKDITTFVNPGGGATDLIETFSDPQLLAGYGKYEIELLITATAADDAMNGTPVKRQVSRTALLSADPKIHLAYEPSPSERDISAIDAALTTNRQAHTKWKDAKVLPEFPLLNQLFPAISITNPSGQIVSTGPDFFAKEKLTLVKTSFVGCGPCRLAEPSLESIDRMDGVRGITLLVQMQEKTLAAVAAGYVKETKSLNNQHDWYTVTNAEGVKLRVGEFPTYLLVDSSGKVIEARAGIVFPEARVKELLAEQSAK